MNIGYWTLDVGYWILDTGIGHWILDHEALEHWSIGALEHGSMGVWERWRSIDCHPHLHLRARRSILMDTV